VLEILSIVFTKESTAPGNLTGSTPRAGGTPEGAHGATEIVIASFLVTTLVAATNEQNTKNGHAG
jgi:hypothetical protein